MADPRRDTPLLAFAAACLVACRVLAMRVLPMYDDAFITLRYARNLAHGHGFVYQAGERVLGTTTPLFGLLCAIPFALHLPMPETVRAFNTACDVVTLVLTWRLLRDSVPPAARWLFAAFFAAGPILNRVSVGGMEMNLYLLVSVLAVRLDLAGRRSGVALAALGYFLRPESLLLVALLVARTGRSRGARAALVSAALAAAIVALPLLGIAAYYGAALSQSVAAKWHMVRPSLFEVLRPLLAYEAFVVTLLPLTAWGLWRALRRAGPVRVIALWMLLQVGAYTAARPRIWSWYVEPIVYGAVVLAACGAADLLARWAGERRAVALRRAGFAAAAAAVAVWIAVAVGEGPSPVTRHVFVPLEAWCRAHAGPTTTFMAADVGALGYYSDSRIYDEAGLVWPPGPTMSAEELLRRYTPDYLFVNVTQVTLLFMASPEYTQHYRAMRRFSKAGETSLIPDPGRTPDVWLQDYLLCERVDRLP